MTSDHATRRDLPVRPRRFAAPTALFYSAGVVGFLAGLAVTIFREAFLPEQFNRDAHRIYNIASGLVPDFRDGSYTPVGLVYRALGLANSPDLAAICGYLLASAAILLALFRGGKRTASIPVALYIVAAFLLAGVYLGQYSKDVFVLVPVILLLVLPLSIWWDAAAVAAMLAYAYFFRDYWAIIALAYVAYRIVLIGQVRLRHLLAGGAVAAAGAGLAFFLLLDVDPNHYRTAVQGHLDANTLIIPLEPFGQPWGGAVDVLINYCLLYVPVLLPFTASVSYIVIVLGYAFIKVFPLLAARSSVRWPSRETLDGALIRRGLSLVLAFGVVQALFEPDFGSALRHFTPLMGLGIVILLATRSGALRAGIARPWSWSGRSVKPADSAGDE